MAPFIISLIAFFIISGLIVWTYQSTNLKNAQIIDLNQQLANSKAELAAAQAKLELLAKDDDRFKALAAQILNENSREFKRQNEERLTEILSPLKSNLDSFHKAVTEAYDREARERFSLSQRIKELAEVNMSIGRQAHDLSEALKGNTRVTGDWGEMVLETILERSGLRKGEEYEIQFPTQDTDGRKLRPDAVVRYPDGRCVVIDSKVSLSAFLEYNEATDQKQREELAARHASQIQRHIDELKGKQYQEYVGQNKLDFVMMFIPNEPAYLAALNTRPQLWEAAYQVNVLIVSPTHLVAALRLIEVLWRRDHQTQNAIKIADEAGKMYDKLSGFMDDLGKIEKSLNNASDSFQTAVKKLSTGPGNVLKRAQTLKELGVKTSKSLPETND